MATYDERHEGHAWALRYDAPGETPTYTTVAFGTGDTLERTQEFNEIVDKSTYGATSHSPDTQSWTHSYAGNLVPGNAGQEALQTQYEQQAGAGLPGNFQFVMVDSAGALIEGAPVFTGKAYVESISIDTPAGELATISVSLRGDGALTRATVPVA